MENTLRGARIFWAVLSLAAVSACASVKVSVPGFSADKDLQAAASLSERVALDEAAQALADQPWGDAPRSDMMSVLFGKATGGRRDQMVKDYVKLVHVTAGDPVLAVMTDADHSLADARRVAEAGRQAVASITPVPSDISILENAISETRECRDMYVKALKMLDDQGMKVSRDYVRDVRDAFSQTITDIGITADLVAERVDAGEGQDRMAQPLGTVRDGDL